MTSNTRGSCHWGMPPPLGVEVASERGGTEGLGVLAAAELVVVTPTFDAPTLGVVIVLGGSWAVGLWRNSWLTQVVAFK